MLHYSEVFTCYNAELTIMICPCEWTQHTHYATAHSQYAAAWRLFILPTTYSMCPVGGNCFSAYVLMVVSKSFNSHVIKRLLS